VAMSDAKTGTDTIQLLVVPDTWCDAEHAFEEVWETSREGRGKVFVINPVLAGRVHTLASDIDKEFAAAGRRLKGVLTRLREHGYIASGRVGDQDPLLAIKDALLHFRADEILVVTPAATDEAWRDQTFVDRDTDLRPSVSCGRVAEAAVSTDDSRPNELRCRRES
jgi:hypothetical protein